MIAGCQIQMPHLSDSTGPYPQGTEPEIEALLTIALGDIATSRSPVCSVATTRRNTFFGTTRISISIISFLLNAEGESNFHSGMLDLLLMVRNHRDNRDPISSLKSFVGSLSSLSGSIRGKLVKHWSFLVVRAPAHGRSCRAKLLACPMLF